MWIRLFDVKSENMPELMVFRDAVIYLYFSRQILCVFQTERNFVSDTYLLLFIVYLGNSIHTSVACIP